MRRDDGGLEAHYLQTMEKTRNYLSGASRIHTANQNGTSIRCLKLHDSNPQKREKAT